MLTKTNEVDVRRREFVKKAAYVAPAIVTLKTAPAYAKNGSRKKPPPRKKN